MMSMLVAALDDFVLSKTHTQMGENKHLEYKWSKDMKERIVQFHFQVTRTDKNGVKKLSVILKELLTELSEMIQTNDKKEAIYYLSVLYKMIGHTRDIIDGKGECLLTYMMILTWYDFFPELSFFAVKTMVELNDLHPYGSWKDLKYLCDYCKNCDYFKKNPRYSEHPLIHYCVELLNDQLKKDLAIMTEYPTLPITLLGKWVPREKSKFGWLYEKLATNYFASYMNTSKNVLNQQKAILKCKTEYRQICSKLNKHIDTLQIKQCGKRWSEINFDNVTSISMMKQKNAFMNTKMNKEQDRIQCAIQFKEYISNKFREKKEIKGARIGMNDFVKEALRILSTGEDESNILNSQWRDNLSKLPSLGKMIAMVDVSGSMEGDPMYAAIALGIQIAEKSILGKRVMTFSGNPQWVDLEPYTDFVSQVKVIRDSEWGFNTNFHLALDTILNVIVTKKLPAEEVENLTLVILSDMQIDSADSCNKDVLYNSIKKKYAETGIKVCGSPYNPLHILFWNLRSTTWFPSLSSDQNVSMMSGFSPSLLKVFCDNGIESLRKNNSWEVLEEILQNERYVYLHNALVSQVL